MPTLEEISVKVDALSRDIGDIKIALKGYNSHQGLIPMFETHCIEDRMLTKDYYNFKRKCMMVFCFLLGAGLLSGGGLALFNYL